jgi:hypothetical protein
MSHEIGIRVQRIECEGNCCGLCNTEATVTPTAFSVLSMFKRADEVRKMELYYTCGGMDTRDGLVVGTVESSTGVFLGENDRVVGTFETTYGAKKTYAETLDNPPSVE